MLVGVGVPLSSGVVAIQAMMGAVPPELSGTASGSMNTFRQFGAVFGVALAGLLSRGPGTLWATFVVAAAGALLAGVLVVAQHPAPVRVPEQV